MIRSERELRQQRIQPLLGVKEGVKRKGDNNVYSSIYVFYWSLRRDKSRGDMSNYQRR